MNLRIAHISDPHFTKVTYSPLQFLSKRWMGNFNYLLFRKKRYQTEHLWTLPHLAASLKVDSVFITGDFSSTSLDEEFTEGKQFAESFQEKGLPTYIVPGNHDCYVRKVQDSRHFFSFFTSDDLKENRVELRSLGKGWSYIGLDCAVAAPPFCAYGEFFESTENTLKALLNSLPASERVIVGNHFPLYPHNRRFHDLRRADALQNLLKQFPQVKLYLHGHDHGPYIIDRQNEGLPLVLNAGSCGHKPNGTFYLIELADNSCLVESLRYLKDQDGYSWVVEWQKHYDLKI